MNKKRSFFDQIEDARIYLHDCHVATVGVHRGHISPLEHHPEEFFYSIYICQNRSNGVGYDDKKGFLYTWFLCSDEDVICDNIYASSEIKSLLDELMRYYFEPLRFDKILLRNELTLYDLN